MSEDFIVYLLEKNYSRAPEDKLSPQELSFLKQQQDLLGKSQFQALCNQAKQNRLSVSKLSEQDKASYKMQSYAKFSGEVLQLQQKQDPITQPKQITQSSNAYTFTQIPLTTSQLNPEKYREIPTTVQHTDKSALKSQQKSFQQVQREQQLQQSPPPLQQLGHNPQIIQENEIQYNLVIETLHAKVKLLERQAADNTEYGIQLNQQIKKQNDQIQFYDQLFLRLQAAIPLRNGDTVEEKRRNIVDFVCRSHSDFAKKQLDSIKAETKALRNRIDQTKRDLKQPLSVDYKKIFGSVEALLQHIQANQKFVFTVPTQLQNNFKLAIVRSEPTFLKATATFLVAPTSRLSFAHYDGFLTDKLNDGAQAGRYDLFEVEVKAEESKQFVEFIQRKVVGGDLVVCGNRCVVFDAGQSEEALNAVGFFGGEVAVFE